jgi:hypothetical protein
LHVRAERDVEDATRGVDREDRTGGDGNVWSAKESAELRCGRHLIRIVGLLIRSVAWRLVDSLMLSSSRVSPFHILSSSIQILSSRLEIEPELSEGVERDERGGRVKGGTPTERFEEYAA